MSFRYKYRNTAAAACYNYIIVFNQAADGIDLNNRLRLRRSNDTAITASCVFNNLISLLFDQLVCLFLGHKCTNRLRRIVKSRIMSIYFYLRQNGGTAGGNASVQHFLPQCILQIVADIPLAHSHAYR